MRSEETPEEPPQGASEDVGAPFETEPRPLPSSESGCSRMLLGGCAVVVLLVGLSVLALMLKAPEVVDQSLERLEAEIVKTLPDDIAPERRERLARAFEGVRSKLQRGEIDAVALRELQGQMLRFASLGRAPTREELEGFLEALEEFAGSGVSDEAPTPGTGATEGEDSAIEQQPASAEAEDG